MRINITIQQLRGVSIIFILFYHNYKTKIINGYLSVSIFLQISGYINIITSINKKNNPLQFYYKRVINIFPELYITIIFILFLNRNKSYNIINSLFEEIISVLKINSNGYFYKKEINYFNQFDNPSFTLHFWYISLQQQIYTIFPILLELFIDYNKVLYVISFSSFSMFCYFSFADPSFSYYSIVCRIYEFILGSISNNINISNGFWSIIQNYIVYIIITIQLVDFKIYRIYKFTVINIASLFLIAIINSNNLSKHFLLNNYYLYLLGNISYELYLIHYPLIQIHLSFIWYIFYLFIISYFLSFIKTLSNSILLIICIVSPLLILKHINHQNKFYQLKFREIIIAPSIDPGVEYANALRIVKKYNPITNKQKICLLVLGDSHIQQWLPSLIRIAKSKNYGIIEKYFHADIIENEKFHEVIQILNKYKIFNEIIISSFYMSNTLIKNISNFIYHFRKYIELLLNYTNHIYIIDDIPFLNFNPLNCIYSNIHKSKCYSILGINASFTPIPFIKNINVKYCNMNKYICIDKKINLFKDGIIIYKDTNHLTLSFSNTLTFHLDKCLNL